MSRKGVKRGPFGDLPTAETQDNKQAIGLADCTSAGCAETVAVCIDASGWPFQYCSIKTGCGRKITDQNKVSAQDAIARIHTWADETVKAQAVMLAETIDLYPSKPAKSVFGHKPKPPVKPPVTRQETPNPAPEPVAQPETPETPKPVKKAAKPMFEVD